MISSHLSLKNTWRSNTPSSKKQGQPLTHLHEVQVLGDDLLAVVHDEHTAHVQLDVVHLLAGVEHVEGSTPRHEQDGPAQGGEVQLSVQGTHGTHTSSMTRVHILHAERVACCWIGTWLREPKSYFFPVTAAAAQRDQGLQKSPHALRLMGQSESEGLSEEDEPATLQSAAMTLQKQRAAPNAEVWAQSFHFTHPALP